VRCRRTRRALGGTSCEPWALAATATFGTDTLASRKRAAGTHTGAATAARSHACDAIWTASHGLPNGGV